MNRRWITPASFSDAIDPRLGKGHRGAGRLRDLNSHAQRGTRSESERVFYRLATQAQLPPWVTNFAISREGREVAILDFAWPELKVCVEIDGRAYHSDRRTFEHDRARQNELVLNGWLVLRFTWEQLIEHPGWVIRQVKEAIARRAALTA